ncbi:MAG TPA: M1 family aminopeptidase, partial [Thermoanaerobaculia bacterium]|nr:M1 family aminopeptidase [Thermoanaerobaculia bacterium]
VRETEGFRGVLAVEETIVPLRALSALSFDLDGLSLSPRLLSRRETSLQEVSLGDGTRLSTYYGGGALVVFLPKPAAAGTPLTLRFRYDAPYFERYGDNYWELPLAGAWYPQPPAVMVQARHGMKAVVRAKKPLVPIAPGKTLRRFEDGEWNAVETILETKEPFQAILAGKYTFFEETKGGVTARVATYGLAKPLSAAKLLTLFHSLREFYEPYFGPFPYAEYTIVEVNDYGFGQAPPGLMRITREAFESNKFTGDLAAQVFSSGVNQRFAHEIAHAWWGGVVWNAQDADVWLVEAFSQMASGRALEVLKNAGEYDRLWRGWRADAKESASRAPIPFARELVAKASPGAGDSLYADQVLLTYAKGPILLVALRKELGDNMFFTVMKSFLKSFATRRPAVVTDDLVGLLEFATKKDWKPWFERYFYGTEVP